MSEISTFAPTAANLWAVIESYGMDPNTFFLKENIELKFPIDPTLRISYKKFDRVRARAAQKSGDEAFGLRTAKFMHPSHLGALGYAWLASRSLRIALGRWQRFIRIINRGARLDIHEHDGLVELEFAVDIHSENRSVLNDSASAALTEMLRFNYGPHLKLSSVSLQRPQPADATPWQSLYGCEVEFGARRNELRVAADLVDTILPSANPHLAQLNEDLVVRYLELLDRQDFTGRVYSEIVQQLPCGHIDQSMVAVALHMTPRTLRRRLYADGLTFKSLLNDIRRELAEDLIKDVELSVTEISFMLGFSESSSFTRAFKNWHGLPPSEAREAALAGR